MFRTILAALAALFFGIGVAHADTVTYNSTPTAGWFYGTGNDYTPANTVVLTMDNGNQAFVRWHNTFVPADASVGDVYSFALGPQQLSFDWGFTDTAKTFVSALITLTNMGVGGGSFSYNPLASGNDNAVLGATTENSARANWSAAFTGFDPTQNGLMKVTLALTDESGGTESVSALAKLGAGVAGVPEPATWAMMIFGFGLVGATLRRRHSATAAA